MVSRLLKLPNFRGKTRLIATLLVLLPVTKSHYGPVMRVRRMDWTNWASIWGLYGDDLKRCIASLPKNGIFLDIGANTGIFSLVASRHLDEGGVVFSFEPNRDVFADLVDNVRRNRATNVFPFNAAVGPCSRLARLIVNTHHSGAGYIEPAGDGNVEAGIPIIVLDLSDLRVLLELAKERPTLCKIDVEGAELGVLDSLNRSGLLPHIDALYIEINENRLSRSGEQPGAIYECLEQAGFTCVHGNRAIDTGTYDEIFYRADTAAGTGVARNAANEMVT